MRGAVMTLPMKAGAERVMEHDAAWHAVFDGTLPAGATFARASGAGVWKGGLLTTVSTDVPRFEVDPATGKPLGLLMENAVTNSVRLSTDLSYSWWAKGGVSVAAHATLSSDGVNPMYRLSETAVTSAHGVYRDITLGGMPGRYVALSVDVKAGERTGCYLSIGNTGGTDVFSVTFDLQAETMTVVLAGNGLLVDKALVKLANGMYRCCVVGRANTTDTTLRMMAGMVNETGARSYAGNTAKGMLMAMPQIEQGLTLENYGSYVANLNIGFDVTRSADVLRWSKLEPTGIVRTRGTFVADFMLMHTGMSSGGRRTVLELGLDVNNRLVMQHNPSQAQKMQLVNIVGGSETAVTAPGSETLQPRVRYRVAWRYGSGKIGVSFMGGALAEAAVGAYPAWTELAAGCSRYGNFALGGWLQRVVYYPLELGHLPSLSAL